MPTSLTMRLTGEEDQRHGPFMASMMQGVLMEMIDSGYAEKLHRTGAHPYSQNVQMKEDELLWTVNALSEEAEEYLIKPLMDPSLDSFHLTHRNETLRIREREYRQIRYEELIQQYYLGSHDRNLTIAFLTPTGFKQNGKYCIFPTPRLIFQSLMLRYDAGATDSSIFSEELTEEFEQYIEITDYRLRSVRFSMEGVRIPSFLGECTFRIRGPQQLVNVAHMLARYGSYSGVGIKTGLGMGAMTIKERQYRR